jgi:hypothetical protein
MGLVRCTVKCKHLLKTVLLRVEEVQMTAEEDMKHVLSYVGYMALDTRTASGDWKRNFPLKSKKIWKAELMNYIQ